MDRVKMTIIEKLKENFDIMVSDTPIEVDKDEISLPSVVFKEYPCDNYIKTIDREMYDKYKKEVNPSFETDVAGLYISRDKGDRAKIIEYDYDSGTFILENNIDNLCEYMDILYIVDEDNILSSKSKDFILVQSPYSYSDTMNYITEVRYRRFDISIFIYEDINDEKVEFYTSKISKLFARDFSILDENKERTRDYAYIQSELVFDTSEYNISNKVIRGSMLLKFFNLRSDK